VIKLILNIKIIIMFKIRAWEVIAVHLEEDLLIRNTDKILDLELAMRKSNYMKEKNRIIKKRR